MRKVSYIPLENILADDPLSRKSRKGWIFNGRGGCQFTNLLQHQLRMNKLPWATLVLYKHNLAAKHGSSKLFTTNELWLLGLRIESTCTLASIYPMHYGICANCLYMHIPQCICPWSWGYLWRIDSVAEILHNRIFALSPSQGVSWVMSKMSTCDAAHWKGDFVAVDFRRYRWKHSETGITPDTHPTVLGLGLGLGLGSRLGFGLG